MAAGCWGSSSQYSRAERPRLFREATQLKTVGPVRRVAGTKPRHVEMQVHATVVVARTVGRGRPDGTLAADVAQRARIPMAIARGGVPGERGSRARGAYLVETTVGGFVVPCTIFFTRYAVRIVREGTVERLVCVFRARKVRPRKGRGRRLFRIDPISWLG